MKSAELKGKQFSLPSGITFKVLDIKFFSPNDVGKNNKRLLDFEPNQLVAINYRGTFIPNITTEQGVACLTSVEVGGRTLTRPKAISEALGITKSMEPIPLKL